ncbi:hypothetical protein SBA2_30101 [Acidobacteriia bacterium SbA2]|nr:hypothetical protein SBA2_30101 [Acidobacteriia bacterium SbA2]
MVQSTGFNLTPANFSGFEARFFTTANPEKLFPDWPSAVPGTLNLIAKGQTSGEGLALP